MTHCTVCGAAAREGAKFCTSCGARLVDTVSTTVTVSPDDTATVPTASEDATTETIALAAPEETVEPAVSDETADAQPSAEETWTSMVTLDATGEVESVPADTIEPEEAATEPAESPEYTSSWPPAEDETAEATGDEVSGDEPPSQPEETWSSWADTTAEERPESPAGTGGAPDSFATDADQDPGGSRTGETRRSDDASSTPRDDRSSPFATDADQDARSEAVEPDRDDPMDMSHHGASQWESWAPEASGGATVPSSGSDTAASVRRLLDDLANRIDRLIAPASTVSRGVDADELADQLDRWSRASTGSADLLEVVQTVRKSPRDVDALTRLADRAPDLELLVRHYQSITDGAGNWARKLRDQGSSDTDDA